MFKVGDTVVYINNHIRIHNERKWTSGRSDDWIGKFCIIEKVEMSGNYVLLSGEDKCDHISRFVSVDEYKKIQYKYRKDKLQKICLKLVKE